MLAALVLALTLEATRPPPPPGFGEPYSPGPYVVFFADGSSRLSAEAREILARVRRDRGILTAASLRICVAAEDRLATARSRRLARAVARAGGAPLRWAREGVDCEIAGGSRRAAGLLAYQLEFGPAS